MKKIYVTGVTILYFAVSVQTAQASAFTPFSFLDLFKSKINQERVVVQKHGPKKPPPTSY